MQSYKYKDNTTNMNTYVVLKTRTDITIDQSYVKCKSELTTLISSMLNVREYLEAQQWNK